MVSPAPGPGSFTFSTEGLPLRARGDVLRDLRDRGVVPLEPLPHRAVHVRVTKRFLPGVGILAGALGGLRQVAMAAEGERDDLFLGVNLAGSSVAVQRGREVSLGSGHAVVLSDAAGPFTITRPTPVRFVGLRVPRRVVAPLLSGRDDPAMRVIPAGTEAVRLLASYATAVMRGPGPVGPEASHVVAAHLHDLVALSIGATRDAAAVAQGRGLRGARLQAIKSDLVANLGDSLTVSAMAARHGVTSRYVHKLFESEGVTYTQFVLRQRLERAYRLLRDARFRARSISAIAYDVGFGDLSYFNRTFRRQFGATPSDVRHAASVTGSPAVSAFRAP